VWECTCPDHIYRKSKCKHIWAVEFSLALRNDVRNQVVIKPLDLAVCVFCGSQSVVKHGLRRNKNGTIQRFTCKDCGKRFTRNLGFEKLKATPQIVTCALQLYFTGESLRNVQRLLRLQGVNVSHQTVYNWIKRYVGLMQKYLDRITPQVSPVWRADELYVKIKGNMKYLFAMMDDETRFWIAQEVADTKYTHDARHLFSLAKAVAGKRPKLLITDGLPAYHQAYMKEYQTNRIDMTTHHIRKITLSGEQNNNKMERLNGEIRMIERPKRGLKREDTPILTGYQIYHNYIRPHEALDGRTPADECGIRVEGQDKWLTLIQNASRSQQDKSRPSSSR
jgi:putative transposase